jgi:hypothetical protein
MKPDVVQNTKRPHVDLTRTRKQTIYMLETQNHAAFLWARNSSLQQCQLYTS